MIRETLELFRSGGLSLTEAALRSKVGLDDLMNRLALLEQGGYVRRVTLRCPSATGPRCEVCAGGCSRKNGERLTPSAYMLTEKGSKALERAR